MREGGGECVCMDGWSLNKHSNSRNFCTVVYNRAFLVIDKPTVHSPVSGIFLKIDESPAQMV